MSRLFEGLSRPRIQQGPEMVPAEMGLPERAETGEILSNSLPAAAGSRGTADTKKMLESEKSRLVTVQPPPTSRLVAWTDPNSLGAEKFRALAVRLDDMRRQYQLNSLQVTSSVINEGKSFVAANLAVTLAKYSGSKTLLIEGDLHRPTLASMFGLKDLQGLSDWWTSRNQELTRYMLRFTGAGLWFLPAGKDCDRPSEILRSGQLAKAFAELAGT